MKTSSRSEKWNAAAEQTWQRAGPRRSDWPKSRDLAADVQRRLGKLSKPSSTNMTIETTRSAVMEEEDAALEDDAAVPMMMPAKYTAKNPLPPSVAVSP